MREQQYQAPKVLVNDEYVDLPKEARYDPLNGEILEPPVSSVVRLGSHSVLQARGYWGPTASSRNLNRPELPDELTYSA